jgi:hypothetical protein
MNGKEKRPREKAIVELLLGNTSLISFPLPLLKYYIHLPFIPAKQTLKSPPTYTVLYKGRARSIFISPVWSTFTCIQQHTSPPRTPLPRINGVVEFHMKRTKQNRKHTPSISTSSVRMPHNRAPTPFANIDTHVRKGRGTHCVFPFNQELRIRCN